jgi:hypothetical protein
MSYVQYNCLFQIAMALRLYQAFSSFIRARDPGLLAFWPLYNPESGVSHDTWTMDQTYDKLQTHSDSMYTLIPRPKEM